MEQHAQFPQVSTGKGLVVSRSCCTANVTNIWSDITLKQVFATSSLKNLILEFDLRSYHIAYVQ